MPLKPLSAVLTGVAIATIVLLALCAKGHSECLHSAKEVWGAHGGAHATWSMRHGEKCWYARTERKVVQSEQGTNPSKNDIRAEAAEFIPLPRPAMKRQSPVIPQLVAPPTPRGLIADEHDQFRTWAVDAFSASPELLFLQDRMLSAGWRLWLQASVEQAQLALARLPPSR